MPTRSRFARTLFIAAMLATAGFGAALAQDSTTGDAVQAPEPANAEGEAGTSSVGDAVQAPDGADGEAPVVRRANLSGEEQIAEGDTIMAHGNALSTHVAQLLDEARREHDIMRITCLNDKLTQVNANITSTEERVAALRDAVATNNDDRRNHEYTVMTVMGQTFRRLEQETNLCIGQEIFDNGGVTRVETSTAPGTTTEDPGHVNEVPPVGQPFVPPMRSGTM